eukprot:scaffold103090_cov43-Phaeocystis_antarctica.AAC.1
MSPVGNLCLRYGTVVGFGLGFEHAADHELAYVDERLDVLLHVARQPGDELVAQREQLLRRAGRQRAQPRLTHVEQRTVDAAGRQHLRHHLLGDTGAGHRSI